MALDISAQIRRCVRTDVEAVTATLTTALAAGRLGEWLVPDPGLRQHVWAHLVAAQVAAGLEHGDVYRSEDGAGAAVWFRDTTGLQRVDEHEMSANLQDRSEQFGTEVAWRIWELETAIAKLAAPHTCTVLGLVGVRPDRQGLCIGSALLDHYHRNLDALERTAVVIAASRRVATGLFARHGYTVLDQISQPQGPTLWLMRRYPSAYRPELQPVGDAWPSWDATASTVPGPLRRATGPDPGAPDSRRRL